MSRESGRLYTSSLVGKLGLLDANGANLEGLGLVCKCVMVVSRAVVLWIIPYSYGWMDGWITLYSCSES